MKSTSASLEQLVCGSGSRHIGAPASLGGMEGKVTECENTNFSFPSKLLVNDFSGLES